MHLAICCAAALFFSELPANVAATAHLHARQGWQKVKQEMGENKDYRDLEAWQVAMDAVMKTYGLTTGFAKSESYGLSGQMRRAAVSVPSNIAEGQARRATGAFLNHLGIALGSLAELDTQLEVSFRLGYASFTQTKDFKACIESGRRLIHGLRRSQRKRLMVTGAMWAGWVILAFRLFA